MKREIASALEAWYGLSGRDRRAIGRFSLLVLVFASTHSAFAGRFNWNFDFRPKSSCGHFRLSD